jgi:hypothetical protein
MIGKNRIKDHNELLEQISEINTKIFKYIIHKIKTENSSSSGSFFGLRSEKIVEKIKTIENEESFLKTVSRIKINLFYPSFRNEINSFRFTASGSSDKDSYMSFIPQSYNKKIKDEELENLNFIYFSLIRDVCQSSPIIGSMLFKITEEEAKLIAKTTSFDLIKIKNYPLPFFEINTVIGNEHANDIVSAIINEDIFYTNLMLRKSAMRSKTTHINYISPASIVFDSMNASDGEKQYNYSVSYVLGKWLSEEDMHPYNIGAILPRISRSNRKKLTNKKGNKPRGSSWIMNSNNDRIIANIILGLVFGLNLTKIRTGNSEDDFRRFGEDHVARIIQINEGYHLFINGLISDDLDQERYLPQSSNGKKINSERVHFLINGIEDKDIYEVKCSKCGVKSFIHHKNPRAGECGFCHKESEKNSIEDF